MFDALIHMANEAAASPDPLQWVYVLIPALFGGYGIATIVQHFTNRANTVGAQRLEGTRLGQDIMEKAMIRLDKELEDLRKKDEERDLKLERTVNQNNALIRYLTKVINSIKAQGGNVPLVDPEDEPYLEELSKFAKADNAT